MTVPFVVTVSHFERVAFDGLIYCSNINEALYKLREKCRELYPTLRPLTLMAEDYSGKHIKEETLT